MKRILVIGSECVTKTHEIPAMTKIDIFQLNFSKSDQTIG